MEHNKFYILRLYFYRIILDIFYMCIYIDKSGRKMSYCLGIASRVYIINLYGKKRRIGLEYKSESNLPFMIKRYRLCTAYISFVLLICLAKSFVVNIIAGMVLKYRRGV